jgi:hypothetical protein
MLLVKPSTVVVLSLLAASRHVRAVPYDSYPTYPASVETASVTSASDNSNDINGKNALDDLGGSLQRAWEGIACMRDCRKTWGWTGNHFGGDPWGGVLEAGDPEPYVPQDSNANANTNSGTESTTATAAATATTSTSVGGFGILDVTTTSQAAVTFSVFNVPTLQRCV